MVAEKLPNIGVEQQYTEIPQSDFRRVIGDLLTTFALPNDAVNDTVYAMIHCDLLCLYLGLNRKVSVLRRRGTQFCSDLIAPSRQRWQRGKLSTRSDEE